MPSEDNPSEQPQRTSHHPGPLTILAATAIGGVLATRMGKTPFLLAASAAAIALLKQKVPAPAPVPQSLRPQPPAPPSAPELDLPAQNLVEQWLSKQMLREEQAPVVEFSTDDIPQSEPEDDYHPESFLLDDAEEVFRDLPDNNSFARLSEPAPQPVLDSEPELSIEEEPPVPQAPPLEASFFPPQVLEAPAPAIPAADAAWTLGVDPLPSLGEALPFVPPAGSLFFGNTVQEQPAASMQQAPPSSLFSSAPVQEEFPGPPLFFSTSVFQGAAFPDEIQVAPSFDPVPPVASSPPITEFSMPEPPAYEAPLSAPEPAPASSIAEEIAQEISVEFASPGEASFDPPLAALTHNPWEPEPDVHAPPPLFPAFPFPAQTQMSSSVVEAEIILRPRAPTQNTVTAKSKYAPPSAPLGKHFPTENSEPSPAEAADDAHFPGPLQAPNEPKPRPTWRSWWRGD